MKKVRLIPLILAMSLPIAGCSFDDLMFWKKKNNGEDTPAEQEQPSGEEPAAKTVTGISAVHTKEEIEKGKELLVSEVDLDLSYSDGSSGSAKAERVSLDTSSVGTKTGTAFYGQFFKDFTIEVVEPAVKTIIEITEVHAPGTIEQNAQLSVERVTLDVKYSDGSTDEGIHPESISLVTSALGEVTGTVFVGNVFKTFTITVVEQESPDTYPVQIKSVSTPESIVQDEVLLASQLMLKIEFSDGSEADLAATKVDFDSSKTGTIEGTAYYFELSSKFTLLVTPKGPDTSKPFEDLKNTIVNDHNYKLEIESYYQEHPEEHFESSLSNINDEVYYGLDPYYPNIWESGYIKVKDQGIASFKKGLESSEIKIEQFVSTNSSLGMHDVFGEMIEYLFESNLISDGDNHWKITNQDLVGMFGTFSGIEDMRLFSNPEQIDIVKNGDNLKITGIYSLTYLDEETGDPTTDHLYVGVDVKDIGTTSNSLYEQFAKADSSKLPTPVAWDEDAVEDFGDYYNNYVPPFIEGATYAMHQATEWNGLRQKYEIKVEDLACGDLTSSYVSQLSAEGYEPLGDGIYTRRIENEDHSLADIYRVEISYRAATEAYGGKTIGYYYPNGVFQVTYIMYTELISLVENVELLNTYLGTTAASDILPRFSSDFNEAKIAGFEDRTALANQNVTGSEYGYIFTSGPSTYFKIYIPTYEDAIAFEEALVNAAAAKGFTSVSHGVALLPMMSMTDVATSYISITDLSLFTKSSYESSGYLQCRIVVYDHYDPEYTVDYDDSDAGVKSIVRIDPNTYYVAPGETVTFKVNIVEGFEIDEVTSNAGVIFSIVESTDSYVIYSFIMPEQDITVHVSAISKAADEGLEYGRPYTVYIGRTDGQVYYEYPTDQGSNRYQLTFNENGTGTYVYQWILANGNTSGSPSTITFTYTLINGEFMITCVDGSHNALFNKYRLFDAGVTGYFNETGVFADNEITIYLSDGASEPSHIEVTFK